MSDSFGIICKAKVNRIISRNNPRTIERHFAISRNTGVKCLSFCVLQSHMVLEKEDKEMAHKRKTVTDLDQRVIERKKKYVRYQEGAELYSMGVNTFREVARDAKATVRIKGIVLVNIEIFEEYLELFMEDF